MWRSRVIENGGKRRVNYYIKYLLLDANGGFHPTLEWIAKYKNPKIVCHDMMVLMSDLIWFKACQKFDLPKLRGAPSTVRNFMTSSQTGCSMNGGPSKKGKGTNRTGGSRILKLIWGGNLLYFPGFGISNRMKPGNSEFALRAFPGRFRISLRNCLTVLWAPPRIDSVISSGAIPDPPTLS